MSERKIKVPTIDDVAEDNVERLEPSLFKKYRRNDADSSTNPKEVDVQFTSVKEAKEPKEQAQSTSEVSTSSAAASSSSTASSSVGSSGVRSVIVNGRQKGNPVLKFVRNVAWEWGETTADFVLGVSCCALFLSVKYHKLHPNYIHERFKKVGRSFALQVLLVQVDVDDPDNVLRELNSMCFMAGWTLILSWSPEETAEYVEAFKIYENKPPEFIMGNKQQLGDDDRAKLVDLLTAIRSVTKTDADMLIEAFGSLKAMTEASLDELALCRGVGQKKAKRIFAAFSAPFDGSARICPEEEPFIVEEFDDEFT